MTYGMGPHAEAARHVVGNAVRRRRWLREHPGDKIRPSRTANRFGEWHECVRDGEQIAEANDIGMLLDRLESDFR